jgi:hypothetical protein
MHAYSGSESMVAHDARPEHPDQRSAARGVRGKAATSVLRCRWHVGAGSHVKAQETMRSLRDSANNSIRGRRSMDIA